MTVRSWRLFILGLKTVLYLKYHSWLSVFFGGRGKPRRWERRGVLKIPLSVASFLWYRGNLRRRSAAKLVKYHSPQPKIFAGEVTRGPVGPRSLLNTTPRGQKPPQER